MSQMTTASSKEANLNHNEVLEEWQIDEQCAMAPTVKHI